MKDQQTNNIGTQKEVNNATPWQENAKQDGNNVPSPGKNEGVGAQDEPLTTDDFHTLLELNIIDLSMARRDYATAISNLQQSYDDAMDIILKKEHQANSKLREAREEFERAKEAHELFLRKLKRERNEVGRIYNEDKAGAKNRWAEVNENIQAKRHNIFERYRNSGGALSQGTEGLLHPSWTKDKKGGMSDEEQ